MAKKRTSKSQRVKRLRARAQAAPAPVLVAASSPKESHPLLRSAVVATFLAAIGLGLVFQTQTLAHVSVVQSSSREPGTITTQRIASSIQVAKVSLPVRPPQPSQAAPQTLIPPVAVHPGDVAVDVPILMYHDTPADFDHQLQTLKEKNYTAVDLDQVAAAMSGQAILPLKPVVITFDDGYASQLAAFNSLMKYHMKAIFYIIDGGESSKWCIGAGRRYNDPLQPEGGCGSAYLNWGQIRMIDRSGLISIGAHTINHPDLAQMTEEQQRYEIATGKRLLEEQLGHPVRHFAYPYGSYNETSLRVVRDSGFVTAVTTKPGTSQGPGMEYELHRDRSVYALP